MLFRSHSGDATLVFPPQKLYAGTLRAVRADAEKIAAALHISGPFNIQFLAREGQVRVIECNLRASRSFPFVSKVMRRDLIGLATRVMLGQHPEPCETDAFALPYVAVKASQFSFARLQEADPRLGVDMASTGEAACLGHSFEEALLGALLSVGQRIPARSILISSGDPLQKADLLPACRLLAERGYELYTTEGTWRYLYENGIRTTRALWPSDRGNPVLSATFPQVLDLIAEHKVEMVINIPKNRTDKELDNGYKIRRAAIDANIPLFTDARLATAFIGAFCHCGEDSIEVKEWWG